MSGAQAAAFLANNANSSPPATYRYFRLDIAANNGASFASVAELVLLVGATAYPTSAMTGPSAPSPLVATASSTQGTHAPWYAFNHVGGDSCWSANATTGWLKIDLGAGNEITPSSFSVSVQNTTPSGGPKTFTLSASNDDSSYTVLASPADQTGWGAGETRTFTL